MDTMYPYQALCKVSPAAEDEILVAACGPNLISARLGNANDAHHVISRWPASSESDQSTSNGTEPQNKKRKLEQTSTTHHDVTLLTPAPDQQHIVAVTGVDKCIRVFSLVEGVLMELSQRCMPKRPCAIQITDDSETIICGDKFGDVYSLPLHPPANDTNGGTNGAETAQAQALSGQRVYEPTATELTVHTKRNLKALQEQLKAKGKLIKSTREPSAFEHKLLLGHVSMLTDMQLVTVEAADKSRRYIVTCDRDEHIRISRGIPQTHITESYCLGHTEFVHRIRRIPGSRLLVSGGGDNWLGVWDWSTGQLLARKDLQLVRGGHENDKKPIAVSNIWMLSIGDSSLILIACEGVDALAYIDASDLESPESKISVVDTSEQGHIFDIVDLGSGGFIVSSHRKRLEQWRAVKDGVQWSLRPDTDASTKYDELNNVNVPGPGQADLEGLLHGVERLRKRENEAEQDE
ncbi:hypothetical protein BDZ85DRAFT_220153 [Elsinoe ampelina]|uniref:Uncharacterized protein n=1 Tax=Elsinoe ampelina TaxID=302913 RepID=A0A6A6G7V7_9PEZI|nr:hypothetical protein BDZ85DRAFT_220153 [Elsinoe ampelina]